MGGSRRVESDDPYCYGVQPVAGARSLIGKSMHARDHRHRKRVRYRDGERN